MADPVLLDLHFPPTLQDGVSSQLAHVRRSELVDLSGTGVLFE
jgi:hypothetical protein